MVTDLLGAIKNILEGGFLGGFRETEDHHSKAVNGDYRFQFCPHCGRWTPQTYSVALIEAAPTSDVAEDSHAMDVTCENCEVQSLIITVDDDADPPRLVDEELPDLGSELKDRLEDDK